MSEYQKTLPQPSKSERKRQMLALQKMGETLLTLSVEQLKQIPIDGQLYDAILEAKKIKSHEGKRRQLQFIGRLMRAVNSEPIELALKKIQSKNNLAKAEMHLIERWRDQLIEDPQALKQFLAAYPETSHQQLKQHLQNTKKNLVGANTLLFRYLREIIQKET